MLKKIISTMLIMILLMLSTPAFAAIPGYILLAKEIKVFIDSKEVVLSLSILFNNNRTLYPFRELLESIGAEVNWDQHTKTARAYYNGIQLHFPLEKDYYFVNGKKRTMDTKTTSDPAVGRTYIPIRYAFEALGYDVNWIPCMKHNEIRISNLGPYEPVSDEAFLEMHEDRSDDGLYSKFTTSQYYDIDTESKRLLFKDGYDKKLYGDYELEEKINHDINRQVYNLTKALIGDGEFVYLSYLPGEPYRVILKYAKSLAAAQDTNNLSYFDFVFFEREYFNNKSNWMYKDFSDKSIISLRLHALWWDFKKEVWSTPFYEKKLRDSFIALFGEKDGTDIYKYVFSKYIQMRNIELSERAGLKEVNNFGNIQVDFGMGDNSTLNFYFSYIK